MNNADDKASVHRETYALSSQSELSPSSIENDSVYGTPSDYLNHIRSRHFYCAELLEKLTDRSKKQTGSSFAGVQTTPTAAPNERGLTIESACATLCQAIFELTYLSEEVMSFMECQRASIEPTGSERTPSWTMAVATDRLWPFVEEDPNLTALKCFLVGLPRRPMLPRADPDREKEQKEDDEEMEIGEGGEENSSSNRGADKLYSQTERSSVSADRHSTVTPPAFE
jgi:hypothetical protein